MKRTTTHKHERGEVSGWMITAIGLIVAFLAVGSLAIWIFFNYQDQKNNVDTKVGEAVAIAKKEQADEDEIKFAAREKEPNREFTGPDDYGRLAFMYPKTWSVYVAKEVARAGGVYEAYLNPITVPPVSADQQFATRVLIETKNYDEVLKQYEQKITKGELRSSTFNANGENGVRIDGTFSENIRGSAVIFKLRDKVVTIRTDADFFKPDFDALIATIKFNS